MAKDDVELKRWDDFKKRSKIKSIDIPYGFTVGAFTVTGVFYLRDPFEKSSTEGIVVGLANGTYTLDQNNQEARFYDPSGELIRLIVHFDVPGKELWGRVDTRRWDGKWDEGSRVVFWRG
ncbi:hypothetical protein [Pseudomonas putida]|uniref:hypothetical protein n=1 Tax=Pseudomonas putida TaxID=303 RepID=UPI002AC5C12E|nr:hypothetical protein [Pseudomonas putida]MDZ5111918.1 hypothetical protein [Pseudomonas putida]